MDDDCKRQTLFILPRQRVSDVRYNLEHGNYDDE